MRKTLPVQSLEKSGFTVLESCVCVWTYVCKYFICMCPMYSYVYIAAKSEASEILSKRELYIWSNGKQWGA